MTDQQVEFETPQEALAHFGVKGMKWGVRNEKNGANQGPSNKEARTEVRALAASARSSIRDSRRAMTPAEKEAAAKRYETEVLNKIQTPEFKAAYQQANTMGKGEMAVQLLAFGPLAAITIPATRKVYKSLREEGYEMEIDTAHQILKEMRS